MSTLNQATMKRIKGIRKNTQQPKSQLVSGNERERNLHQMKLIISRFKFYQQKEEP